MLIDLDVVALIGETLRIFGTCETVIAIEGFTIEMFSIIGAVGNEIEPIEIVGEVITIVCNGAFVVLIDLDVVATIGEILRIFGACEIAIATEGFTIEMFSIIAVGVTSDAENETMSNCRSSNNTIIYSIYLCAKISNNSVPEERKYPINDSLVIPSSSKCVIMANLLPTIAVPWL